jgi:phage shock protein A
MSDQLQSKVEDLKRQISKYENEAITLKARARTASSMRKINQQLAGADASGTVAMLEKMKQKVQEEESLAEAYDQLADVGSSIDDDLDKALAAPSSSAGADSLAALKKKMGIGAASPPA